MRHSVTVCLIIFIGLTNTTFAKDNCRAVYGDSDIMLRLATGSPGELGLLEELANSFNHHNGTSICWKKAGSGKSLKMLRHNKVDVALVHAPAAEKQAVTEGWAAKRTLIGSNEFYIVGPTDDPAGIATAKTVAEAYRKIAEHKKLFLSRGDNSGTNKKELGIWEKAGIEPQGEWYVITKDFMMATLKQANQQKGYFMTDSSTWVAAKKELRNLKVLFSGDPLLINTYHGLCRPEMQTPRQKAAAQFIDFIGSETGQQVIRMYGKKEYGQPMYNDAQYASKFDH